MSIIAVKNLTVKYNSLDVFSNVSFIVEPCDYVAIAGPNGSGKTTLIKTILGLISPTAGDIFLFGSHISEFSKWYKIGYIPQKLTFNPYFPATVKEIIEMGLISNKSFPKKIVKGNNDAIDRVLSMMEIMDLKKRSIGELSGGQQQRVIIARALVSEPDLLILDEPTTAIDPDAREKFFSILNNLNRDKGTTIILITHDTGAVGKYASKLLYFDRKVIFYGTFKDFCESPKMAEYFGAGSQHLICHRHDQRQII